jgi:protein-tyrosine-phosphatase
MAELFTVQALSLINSDVIVSSSGTEANEGQPIDVAITLALRERGFVTADAHTASRMTKRKIEESDLILTAGLEHLLAVMIAVPSAKSKVFTMREFTSLAAGLPAMGRPRDAAGLHDRVVEIGEQRAGAGVMGPAELDIADPYRRGIDAARRCAAEVSQSVQLTLAALGLDARAKEMSALEPA